MSDDKTYFSKPGFFFSKNVTHMNGPHDPLILRYCKFIFSNWPHGSAATTKRNCRTNIRSTRRVCRFRRLHCFRCRSTENDFYHELTQLPHDNITLWQNRLTNHAILRECVASGPRQSRKNIRKSLEIMRLSKTHDFSNPATMHFVFWKCSSHDRPPWSFCPSLQIHFSNWSHGLATTTNRSCLNNSVRPKEFTDFKEFNVFTNKLRKNMFSTLT